MKRLLLFWAFAITLFVACSKISEDNSSSFQSQTAEIDPKLDGNLTSITAVSVEDPAIAIVTQSSAEDKLTITGMTAGSTIITVAGKNSSDETVAVLYRVTVAADGTITYAVGNTLSAEFAYSYSVGDLIVYDSSNNKKLVSYKKWNPALYNEWTVAGIAYEVSDKWMMIGLNKINTNWPKAKEFASGYKAGPFDSNWRLPKSREEFNKIRAARETINAAYKIVTGEESDFIPDSYWVFYWSQTPGVGAYVYEFPSTWWTESYIYNLRYAIVIRGFIVNGRVD